VGRIHAVDDGAEIARRRKLVGRSTLVEAWPDLYQAGRFWLGDESKAALDAAGAPLPGALSLDADAVSVFYGPRLGDVESLPLEDSLRARVLSARGIAVAWITLDRFGERVSYEPKSPADPVFHLRRPGGGAGHVWRRFETKREAVDFMREAYGADSEAVEWAETLPADDFDTLLRRFAASGT